jgi:hypothetical protein
MPEPSNAQHIANRIRDFNERFPVAEHTFAHIVIGDFNLSQNAILSCYDEENFNMWLNQMDGMNVYQKLDYMNIVTEVDILLQELRGFSDDELQEAENILRNAED